MRALTCRSAFTLIELLVVLAIIGTLIGLMLPAVHADGHVQAIEHGWLTANQNVWDWQNTNPLQFP